MPCGNMMLTLSTVVAARPRFRTATANMRVSNPGSGEGPIVATGMMIAPPPRGLTQATLQLACDDRSAPLEMHRLKGERCNTRDCTNDRNHERDDVERADLSGDHDHPPGAPPSRLTRLRWSA